MATVQFRGLAAKGILCDPSPYELDLDAWSGGSNVRFHANKVQRAPVFRNVLSQLGQTNLPEEPGFVIGLEPSTGYDQVFSVGMDGRIWQYAALTLAEVSAYGVLPPTITLGGSGYTAGSPPAVTFSAPTVSGGMAATGTAVVTGTAVTAIVLTNPGLYPPGSATPTVTIHPPTSGTTATATTAFEWAPDAPAVGDLKAPPAFTSTFLGDVLYVNNPSWAPQYWQVASSTSFHNLPNQECEWTCRTLRAYSDYLFALNVTKPANYVDPATQTTMQGGSFPTMIKWSDLSLFGQPPDSWDPDDTTKSTGENILEQATSPIVDGAVMRNLFVIYTENDVWGVQPSGDNNIFAVAQLFSDGGMIAPNCAVQVNGVHYVFGPTDIYRHDGVTKQSIIDKRNKEKVFRFLNIQRSEVCFAAYQPQFNQIVFGYSSSDPVAFYPALSQTRPGGCDRCNYAAVYDLTGDTWSFIDLPNVSGFALANLDTVYSCATMPSTMTCDTIGGTFSDMDNTYTKSSVAVAGAISGYVNAHYLLGYDFMNNGILSFPVQADCNAPAFVQRVGLALDQEGSDLTTAKKLRRIWPLVFSYDQTIPVQVQAGSAMYPSGPITWNPQVAFQPQTQYKVDTIITGRYLAVQFTVNGFADFEVTGFDADITNNGRR